MNTREGMRRLGIVLGVLGGVLGGFFGYSDAQNLWNTRMTHRKFESIMALPTMQKVAKADWVTVSGGPVKPPEGYILTPSQGGIIEVNLEGIKRVLTDKTGMVSSIELLTGETVRRTEPPTLQAYLAPLFFPVIGFLLPWGAVRVLTWVGIGFLEPPR